MQFHVVFHVWPWLPIQSSVLVHLTFVTFHMPLGCFKNLCLVTMYGPNTGTDPHRFSSEVRPLRTDTTIQTVLGLRWVDVIFIQVFHSQTSGECLLWRIVMCVCSHLILFVIFTAALWLCWVLNCFGDWSNCQQSSSSPRLACEKSAAQTHTVFSRQTT